ncbi:MAG: NUDIX hydrolase [Nocardioides sp.]
MTLHADALAVLRGWSPPSTEQEALRDRYVAHLEQHPDGMRRSCLPSHVTASVMVFDSTRSRLLLTLHAKSGRWFQFGGHTEDGDTTLAGAALREAVEESGVAEPDLGLDPVPVLMDAHAVPFCGPTGDTWHLDVMFVARARDGVRHSVSEESLDVAWWPLDDLPNAELAPFVELALARLRVG